MGGLMRWLLWTGSSLLHELEMVVNLELMRVSFLEHV